MTIVFFKTAYVLLSVCLCVCLPAYLCLVMYARVSVELSRRDFLVCRRLKLLVRRKLLVSRDSMADVFFGEREGRGRGVLKFSKKGQVGRKP